MTDDGYFGERVAARYDEQSPELGSMFSAAAITPVVDRLVELAAGGRALEFAIGTGRIALPLARRGVEVHGIELSKAMLRRLRAKPGGDRIPVMVGDMATTRAEGQFSLVYLVFNTIDNLTSQQAQIDCFSNAAAHLAPGGLFLVEVGVPDLQRLPPGERYRVFAASPDHWGIDEFDIENQGMISHHFQRQDGRWDLTSTPFRYAWPAELDLMAELAGMSLVHRWAGWHDEPFGPDSEQHVSVWQKS